MIDVIPLKYGPTFKKVFSNPEMFSRFASDVLDMPLTFKQVHTEYEYHRTPFSNHTRADPRSN